METLLLTLSPFAVAIVAQVVKVIIDFGTRLRDMGGVHAFVLRFIVALLSLLSVIGSAILSGQEVDVASIETFAEALIVFLGATGSYFLAKKKNQ